MKKGILVSGIIWAILCIIGALVCGILGAVYAFALQAANSDIIAQAAQQSNVTIEEAKAIISVASTLMFVAACEMVAGFVFSIILMAKRNSAMSKGPGIALGVVGAVLGATLPGILFIVDSAKNRK